MRKIEEVRGRPKYGSAVPWLRRNRAKAALSVSGGLTAEDKKMHDDILEVGDGERGPQTKGINPEVYLRDIPIQ
jgi:hypothetical protein